MKRLILIAILSSSIAPMSCNTDRGTILNMPFFSVFGNKSAAITSFAINGVVGTINGTDITLTLPCDGVLNELRASFTITGERVEVNGVEQKNGVTRNDFTNPVVYTVYTKTGSSKDYTVHVTIANYSAKDITLFSINGIPGDISGTSISLVLPYGTDPSCLVATYNTTGREVRTGGAIQISGETPNNFSSPRTYTVEACDGSTQNYTVIVTIALNNAKDITAFSILGINGTIGTNTISLTVPYGTDRTDLTPAITHTGASVSPASGESVDFSDPVEYTVTAANGTTKQYTVTVNVALNDAKDITEFAILGNNGSINQIDRTITVTVPYLTDKRYLTPAITHTGESVSPLDGSVVDFTNPVVFTVTAADGTTKDYTVTVTVAANPAKDITAFIIPGASNVIIETNKISLTVPFGSGMTHTPSITITGISVSPASGIPQDFSDTVYYTVTAADSSTKVYAVTVTEAPSNAKDITAFTILGRSGDIEELGGDINTITVTVPFDAHVESLTPTITHTGASVSPASLAARDFTFPVDYTVTAADGTTKVYTVTVIVEPNDENDITAFSIDGYAGTIGTDTVTLILPYNHGLLGLTPTISVSANATINPESGVARNFESPVIYTVTAENGTSKAYTVTVTEDPGDDCDITSFSINGRSGTIGSNTISLNLPYGTPKTALGPVIAVSSGASVSPDSGVARDFTNPVAYTVTALNGTTTKEYTVTVTANLNGTYATGYYHDGTNYIACLWNISEAAPSRIDLESSDSTAVSASVSSDTVYIAGTYGGTPCYWKISGENATRHDLDGTGTVVVSDSLILGSDLYISGINDAEAASEACYWVVDLDTDTSSRVSLVGGAGGSAHEMTESGGILYIAGTAYSSYDTPCYWSIEAGADTQHLVYHGIAYGKTVMIYGSNRIIGGWFDYNSPYTQALTWTYSSAQVPAVELPPVFTGGSSSYSIVSASLNSGGDRYFAGQRTGMACYWLNGVIYSLDGDDSSAAYGIKEFDSELYMAGYVDAQQTGIPPSAAISFSTACVWKKTGPTVTRIDLDPSTTGEAAARDVFVKD
jgi:hypothetical protein